MIATPTSAPPTAPPIWAAKSTRVADAAVAIGSSEGISTCSASSCRRERYGPDGKRKPHTHMAASTPMIAPEAPTLTHVDGVDLAMVA
jgi:hypothetical protein